RIKSYGIEGLADIIDKCNVDVDVKSHIWDEEGDKVSSTELAMGIGIGLSFLTYMFVLMYGAMMMSSVVEDKTNRIVEVIVSSCRPMELMLGKIMGIALVGLTQIAIWAILITGITAFVGMFGFDVSSPVASPGMPAVPATGANEVWEAIMGVDWVQLIGVFVLYFIGGYLLYASLFAGFGSAVDQQSDANQFTTPIMIVIIIALYAGMACMDNPDGQLAVWCSMIPFTSPIVMMIRLPYHIPFWEVIISLVLLYGTAVLFAWIASRIYRTGILMYGRKVSFGEILRWIKK
ncbi:MAG: ABC transporter permease, partial [Muribaculaceae bacterium]|nr:ABC transporter permease [Muribaculaceae bacterium]